MNYFYVVTQVWLDPNGTPGIQGFIYFDEEGQLPAVNRALSKYHDILRIGAISEDKYHGAEVKRSDGTIIKPFEYYDRRPVTPAQEVVQEQEE